MPPSHQHLFFHYTNLDRATREDDLRVGDAVWFRDGNDGRSGKPTAMDVGATREAEDRARAGFNADARMLNPLRAVGDHAGYAGFFEDAETRRSWPIAPPDDAR